MITKLLVLAAAMATVWALFKLLGKVGRQNQELKLRRDEVKLRRAKDAERKAASDAKREANIIDVELDPESGTFEEKKDL